MRKKDRCVVVSFFFFFGLIDLSCVSASVLCEERKTEC